MITFMISPAQGTPILDRTVTKGLSSTPALSHGISAAMTTIEPMKKMVRRARVARIARGMVVPGSSTSPAVTPMSSVPEKAKLMARIVVNTAPNPLGKRPSWYRFVSPRNERCPS